MFSYEYWSAMKPHWDLLKQLWADVLLVFSGLFYMAHFMLFLLVGEITVGENNKVILGLEIAACLLIITLGVERFKKHFPRTTGKRVSADSNLRKYRLNGMVSNRENSDQR